MPSPLPPQPLGTVMFRGEGQNPPSLEVECYLDLICPFSAKMFSMLYDQVVPQLIQNKESHAAFRIHHVVQPWHPQSTMVHEAALAVRAVLGTTKYLEFVSGVYAAFGSDDKKFSDADTWNKTRTEIYEDLLSLVTPLGSEDDKKAVRAMLIPADGSLSGNSGNGLTQELKWACRHHRARGVHVTPTVFVNGIEAGQVSSGWTKDQWMEFLKK